MDRSEKRSILLLVLFLFAAAIMVYHKAIVLPPSYIHAWTQSERYAIALRFLDNGFDIFHPATFNLQTVDGITRMDFPLNEFVVAILMKIFGTSPSIFRIYTLCLGIIGLSFLYLLAKRLTRSDWKSILVVAFVFCSPLYMYYQAGFIPCVPAISFVFTAYYFFHRYKTEGKRNHFFLTLLFFFLAAMIRLPFFIFLFAFFLQQGFLVLRSRKFIRFEVLGFAFAFFVFLCYSLYNHHLGKVYGNMFLDRFLPAKSVGELLIIIKYIWNHWLLQYFTFWHYFLLIVVVVCTIWAWRKTKNVNEKALWFNLLIVGVGATLYFLLMACQYFDHDYYFLDSLFLPIVLLYLLGIRNVSTEGVRKWVFFFVSGVCLLYMLGDAKKNQGERYNFDGSDRVEISRRNFEGSEDFLNSIGIWKEAKMLVIDSYSTNIPLYMMNRKGYTTYQTSRDNPLVNLFQKDWDYVVIQDQFLFSDVLRYYPVVATVIHPKAGNGKITIYERNKVYRKQDIDHLLQLEKRKVLMDEVATFEGEQKGHFTKCEDVVWSEHKGSYAMLTPAQEYGMSFKVGANELSGNKKVCLKVVFDFEASDIKGVKIVATTANKGKTLEYQSHKLSDFYKVESGKQHATFFFTLPEFRNVNDILSIYLWNPELGTLGYDNFGITVYSAELLKPLSPFQQP